MTVRRWVVDVKHTYESDPGTILPGHLATVVPLADHAAEVAALIKRAEEAERTVAYLDEYYPDVADLILEALEARQRGEGV